MKMTDKTDIALPLSPAISQAHGEDHGVMPGEFAGKYQAGFESGYRNGRETGFREGYAAAHQGPSNGAAVISAADARPAPKGGPRRMLLGMPCERCRVYLLSGETHCPCCKQPVSVRG